MNRKTVMGIGALLVTSGMAAGTALGTPQVFMQAKNSGLPANNCQYCHSDAVPKKETFTPAELNDRGKFLLDDMKQRNLTAPDVGKLKEYKGAK
jgi:hypothetical protein